MSCGLSIDPAKMPTDCAVCFGNSRFRAGFRVTLHRKRPGVHEGGELAEETGLPVIRPRSKIRPAPAIPGPERAELARMAVVPPDTMMGVGPPPSGPRGGLLPLAR
jgi:hypothetical protein